MAKVFLKLNVKNIDFSSEELNTKIENLEEFIFHVDTEMDFPSEIYSTVIRAKGDWIDMNFNESLDVSYITINLIFHSLDLDDNDKLVIQNVLIKVKEFIDSVREDDLDFSINRLEMYEKVIKEDGFIVSLDEHGGGYELSNVDFEKFFKDNNIEYTSISRRGSWFDGGASAGNDGFIYFIVGAMASGITWDFIKFSIQKLIGYSFDSVIKNEFENLNFEKLREKIEDRCKVNMEDLILKEMYKDSDDVCITFESETVRINLITDSKYRIKELVHENK